MRSAELFIQCLENEGVKYIFGIPGEENLDVMDALLSSDIRFITTRHEQGAAFMADVYGRLTGFPGVCLATLGPGATNLVTGVADGNMDRAPMIAIAGQGSTHRLHKESHQILDLVSLFRPITKYASQILEPEIVPEIVRKAFKVAKAEKPGCSFIDYPENIAGTEVENKTPLKVQEAQPPIPPLDKIEQAAKIISQAKCPVIMAGNGVIRANASEAVRIFAEKLSIPIATTFMAKGVVSCGHPLSLGPMGLGAKDYVDHGFDQADVAICIGYDIVEYHPHLWNPNNNTKIIHIDMLPAEVDEYYILEVGVIGDINAGLERIAGLAQPQSSNWAAHFHDAMVADFRELSTDDSYPVKPQRILWDLRQALESEDIVISDVGAHKMWMARQYQAESLS